MNTKTVQSLIEEYVSSRVLAWSVSTQRSERARLMGLASVLNGDARALWAELEQRKTAPYTRSTMFVRVGAFFDWLIEKGQAQAPNAYKAFKKENAKLFKNAYVRRQPSITFEQAVEAIGHIEDEAIKAKALQLLNNGLRFTESNTLHNGEVVGKGGKTRAVYGATEAVRLNVGYQSFLAALKAVGLKPHDLRKIFLTRAVESGMNVFELQALAGWSTLEPAQSYINVNRASIQRKLATFQGGTSNEAITVSGKVQKAG